MSNTDTTWRDALILDAPSIAGIRVRPLSAWHCHVAQMLDLRLGMVDGRGPTPGDLANLISLCRSQYRPGRVGVPVAGRWLRAYLMARWAFVSWRRDGFMFCNYVDAYRRYPEIRRTGDKDSNPLGCPPYFANAVDVAARLPSLTLADCLNMPLLNLYCIRATLNELNGGASCAWGTAGEDDAIKAALAQAQAAIDRHNAESAHGR